ncbi:MAG: hypothetical protein ACFNYB_06650 [Campylobacter sp.]
MKKLLFIFTLYLPLLACDIKFDIFYNLNTQDERIDRELDKILACAARNKSKINDEFGAFKERLFTPFIQNAKAYQSGKFDLERINAMLKFKPELNYKIDGNLSLLDAVLASRIEATSKFSEDEIVKLADLLLENGAKADGGQTLKLAYESENFRLFSKILKTGADASGVISGIAGNTLIFLAQSGFSVNANAAPDMGVRKFAKEAEFTKFYANQEKFLNELLNRREISGVNGEETRSFIKVACAIDSDKMIKTLLNFGLCDKNSPNESLCKFTKEQAKFYESEKILRLEF